MLTAAEDLVATFTLVGDHRNSHVGELQLLDISDLGHAHGQLRPHPILEALDDPPPILERP